MTTPSKASLEKAREILECLDEHCLKCVQMKKRIALALDAERDQASANVIKLLDEIEERLAFHVRLQAFSKNPQAGRSDRELLQHIRALRSMGD